MLLHKNVIENNKAYNEDVRKKGTSIYVEA